MLSLIQEERERRIKGLKKVDSIALKAWDDLLLKYENHKSIKLEKAFSFGKNINYNHPGMSSEIYFSHPVRVANYASFFSNYKEIDYPILGLLHNVLELSNTNKRNLKELFGIKIFKEIEVLTVERKSQWNQDYKEKYYDDIMSQSHACRLIKILDKLDNLFLLHLNPNKDVINKYLLEVEKYIMPMVKKDLPVLLTYFEELLINTKKISLS